MHEVVVPVAEAAVQLADDPLLLVVRPEMYIGFPSRPKVSSHSPSHAPRYPAARPKSACGSNLSSRAYPIAP